VRVCLCKRTCVHHLHTSLAHHAISTHRTVVLKQPTHQRAHRRTVSVSRPHTCKLVHKSDPTLQRYHLASEGREGCSYRRVPRLHPSSLDPVSGRGEAVEANSGGCARSSLSAVSPAASASLRPRRPAQICATGQLSSLSSRPLPCTSRPLGERRPPSRSPCTHQSLPAGFWESLTTLRCLLNAMQLQKRGNAQLSLQRTMGLSK